MELPLELCSRDALGSLRDDFDFAHLLMKSALRNSITSFTFSGLRLPRILHQDVAGHPTLSRAGAALELTIFQDHLHDRIAALTRNNRIIREIWAFNERSRSFREFELTAPCDEPPVARQIGDLVAALHTCSENAAVAALDRNMMWYRSRIDELRAARPAAGQAT